MKAAKSVPSFYGIGSDPEFLFLHMEGSKKEVMPANYMITANKTIATRAFIGTDGHATTAEMRPNPSHNVGRHLYDIAYGLHETAKWLEKHKRYTKVFMTAQPFVFDEPLGGHIHCSFFLDEPLTKQVQALNRSYHGDRIVAFDPQQPATALTA